jgi:hypothetical protein
MTLGEQLGPRDVMSGKGQDTNFGFVVLAFISFDCDRR